MPRAARLHPRKPLNFRPNRCADAGESEHHQLNQRVIAQADHGAGIDRIEQRPRFLAAPRVGPGHAEHVGTVSGETARLSPTGSDSAAPPGVGR
jgi:hypothetical protein